MSKILSVIVENYVKIGQPVGSKRVCELMEDPPSAATVRNEMASLTVLGLLEQPYTSAGRVPSVNGFRFYVNFLMKNKSISEYEKNYISGMFGGKLSDPESIIQESCEILSKITNCTTIFAVPPVRNSLVKKIKFVQIGYRTVMLILITSSGMVQNQIFNCSFKINKDILSMFRSVVSSEFEGKMLNSLLMDMNRILLAQEAKDIIMIPAFEATLRAVEKACKVQFGVSGKRYLFDFKDPADVFSVLELIDQEEFSNFLFLSSNKTKIYIGDDCGMDVFSNCCIIVEKYDVGVYQGAMALIGPVGISYPDVIAKTKYVAEIVQDMFSEIVNF